MEEPLQTLFYIDLNMEIMSGVCILLCLNDVPCTSHCQKSLFAIIELEMPF